MSLNIETPIVIKVSGKLFSDHDGYVELIKHCDALQHNGYQVVIVHGGGIQLDTQLTLLGRPIEKRNGLRVSTKEDMPIITGVLAGQLNKQFVCDFAKHQGNAIGISLMDFGLSKCKLINSELGQVGQPISGHSQPLTNLLHMGLIPIIASVGMDENSEPCNVNADHAAVHIAKLLSANLLLLSDVDGVLDKHAKVIPELSEVDIHRYSDEGVIKDGMLVKVLAGLEASYTLQRDVFIGSWCDLYNKITRSDVTLGTKLIPPIGESRYFSSTR